MDSGYQRLNKHHQKTELLFKSSKHHRLYAEEKNCNRAISRMPVKIEHIIGGIEIFRIMSNRYRDKLKRFDVKCTIISGIVNMKNEFETL